MGSFLMMAAKNVLRNTRRSFLTCLVIALGLMFMFTVRGFLNGLQGEAIAGIIEGDLGDLQITRIGYQEALPAKALDYLFAFTPEMRAVLAAEPEVRAYSERISFGGLINHQRSQTTTPFMGVAMDPAQDVKVCPRFPNNVKKGNGEFLKAGVERAAVIDTSKVEDIPDADATSSVDLTKPVSRDAVKNLPTKESEYFQVVVGKTMADGFADPKSGIKAKVGDDMILLASDVNGGQHSLGASLIGLLDIANPGAAKMVAVVSIGAARKLLAAEGKATQVVVGLKKRESRFAVQKSLNEKLKPYGLHAMRWDELAPFSQIIELQNMIFGIVMGVIMAIVALAIAITSLMTVMERTREIGALMAMGFNRFHVMSMFLIEGATIGLLGGMIGIALGAVLVTILGKVGLPFVIPFTTSVVTIRPFFTPGFLIGAATVGVLTAVAASLYPAWQASRLKPLEALSHN